MFLTDSKSVLDALARHGEYGLRVKLSKLIENRRVVLQWIPAHCGISSNEKADELAKRGANMQQQKSLRHNKGEEDNYQEYVSSQEDT